VSERCLGEVPPITEIRAIDKPACRVGALYQPCGMVCERRRGLECESMSRIKSLHMNTCGVEEFCAEVQSQA
jgi:hypothetical protein